MDIFWLNPIGRLKGNIIKFPKVSVGATTNTILAASLGNGTTIIKLAAWNLKF